MRKRWLTDHTYSLCGALSRIAYWLGAISLSAYYVQHYADFAWFKYGLMAISLLFVIGFLLLVRMLDHLFEKR